MSQLTAPPETAGSAQLSKLAVSIRGKLQFMDYLVRAAVADVERFQGEPDPGTRIFIKQLVEMHAANLRRESGNMEAVDDLCDLLDGLVHAHAAETTTTRDGAGGPT